MWACYCCIINPSRVLAECRTKRRLNQGSFVFLYFVLFAFLSCIFILCIFLCCCVCHQSSDWLRRPPPKCVKLYFNFNSDHRPDSGLLISTRTDTADKRTSCLYRRRRWWHFRCQLKPSASVLLQSGTYCCITIQYFMRNLKTELWCFYTATVNTDFSRSSCVSDSLGAIENVFAFDWLIDNAYWIRAVVIQIN